MSLSRSADQLAIESVYTQVQQMMRDVMEEIRSVRDESRAQIRQCVQDELALVAGALTEGPSTRGMMSTPGLMSPPTSTAILLRDALHLTVAAHPTISHQSTLIERTKVLEEAVGQLDEALRDVEATVSAIAVQRPQRGMDLRDITDTVTKLELRMDRALLFDLKNPQHSGTAAAVNKFDEEKILSLPPVRKMMAQMEALGDDLDCVKTAVRKMEGTMLPVMQRQDQMALEQADLVASLTTTAQRHEHQMSTLTGHFDMKLDVETQRNFQRQGEELLTLSGRVSEIQKNLSHQQDRATSGLKESLTNMIEKVRKETEEGSRRQHSIMVDDLNAFKSQQQDDIRWQRSTTSEELRSVQACVDSILSKTREEITTLRSAIDGMRVNASRHPPPVVAAGPVISPHDHQGFENEARSHLTRLDSSIQEISQDLGMKDSDIGGLRGSVVAMTRVCNETKEHVRKTLDQWSQHLLARVAALEAALAVR